MGKLNAVPFVGKSSFETARPNVQKIRRMHYVNKKEAYKYFLRLARQLMI